MRLEETYFWRYDLSTRDSKARIVEECEANADHPEDGVAARNVLNHPRNRISQEIAWLPGYAPQRAKTLAAASLGGGPPPAEIEGLDPLARANLLASTLAGLSASAGQLSEEDARIGNAAIRALVMSHAAIDPERVLARVNEDRAVAGIAPLPAASALEEAFRQRSDFYLDTAWSVLNRTDIVDTVPDLVRDVTADGAQDLPSLLRGIVSRYETAAFEALKEPLERFAKLTTIDAAKEAASASAWGLTAHTVTIERELATCMRGFYPMAIAAFRNGLEHELPQTLLFRLRSYAIDLFNMDVSLEESAKALDICIEHTRLFPTVAERVSQDKAVLADIVKKAAERKQEEERFASQVALDVEIGKLSTDRLRITKDVIAYNGESIKVPEVTRVRWGQFTQTVNFIKVQHSRTIWIGTPHTLVQIECTRAFAWGKTAEDLYGTILDKIWPLVGAPMVWRWLCLLSAGEIVTVGGVQFSNRGVLLQKRSLFKSEPFLCPWEDFRHWTAEGNVHVMSNRDRKATASLGFRDVDNVPVLAFMLNFLGKDGNFNKMLAGGFK